LYEQFLIASSLLENFRSGKLSTSKVFDVEKLATFIAVTDLFSANHANSWNNKRF